MLMAEGIKQLTEIKEKACHLSEDAEEACELTEEAEEACELTEEAEEACELTEEEGRGVVVGVTGSTPAVATNEYVLKMAQSLSEKGKRVVLVDCDPRMRLTCDLKLDKKQSALYSMVTDKNVSILRLHELVSERAPLTVVPGDARVARLHRRNKLHDPEALRDYVRSLLGPISDIVLVDIGYCDADSFWCGLLLDTCDYVLPISVSSDLTRFRTVYKAFHDAEVICMPESTLLTHLVVGDEPEEAVKRALEAFCDNVSDRRTSSAFVDIHPLWQDRKVYFAEVDISLVADTLVDLPLPINE